MRRGHNRIIRGGLTTGAAPAKLIASGERFLSDPWAVRIGDLAIREVDHGDNLSAVVTAIDSDTQLSLASDLFSAAGQPYRIAVGDVFVTGTATSIVARELNDSAVNFRNRGVRTGMAVVNLENGRMAWVTEVHPARLVLSRSIFAAIGNRYEVYAGDVIFEREHEELRTRRFIIVGDGTEVTTSSLVPVRLKELLCASSRAGYLITGLSTVLECRASGGTFNLSFRINGVERGNIAITETVYTLRTLAVNEEFPDGSVLRIEIFGSVSAGTGNLRLTEIYALV